MNKNVKVYDISYYVYKKILHMAFPLLPIVNEVVLCGLSGLLLSWDLALG